MAPNWPAPYGFGQLPWHVLCRTTVTTVYSKGGHLLGILASIQFSHEWRGCSNVCLLSAVPKLNIVPRDTVLRIKSVGTPVINSITVQPTPRKIPSALPCLLDELSPLHYRVWFSSWHVAEEPRRRVTSRHFTSSCVS